jgi:HK97 family phage prohead protease
MSDRVDLTSTIKTVSKQLPYGEVEVIVSSSALDRHGENIEVQGINTKEYMSNPVVLWAHNYENLPLGKVLKTWKSDGKLMARIAFATDIVPFAKTVYDLIKAGVINAVSIGGLVKEYAQEKGQTDYTKIAKLDMVELSVVPVGANPEALVTSKALEANIELGDSYKDFISQSMVASKGLDDAISEHIQTTKTLLSALEDLKMPSTATVESSKTIYKKRLVLGQKRKIAKTVKTQTEQIISAVNSELKRIHNDRTK